MIKAVALDAHVALDCIKWIPFVCWVLMEMLEMEEPGLRVYDVWEVMVKDCQRANFLPGNVKANYN
jgi:hypothetical protein